MRPIPVAFHIGPLEVHTYGLGLAITFWVAYRYFAARLRARGYPDGWLGGTFVWVIVAAIVGARAVHVIANFGSYANDPIGIFAVWHGGLSSFGGLALAIPVGLVSQRRRCPQLPTLAAADIVAPVLAGAWALGRLLGPQLMVAGGGKPTSAWYGMYYADQVGRRLPVPIFQALECFLIFAIALALERWIARSELHATGAVSGLVAGLWGLGRFFDEYVLLTNDNGTDAVEIASLCFLAVGITAAVLVLRRARRARAVRDDVVVGAPRT